ncbi:sigma-70 family RNA polymerase sigma factor [Verrucomicrobiales bacterium]|mgnify:CR=1 FL=1|jgi:RNA polymerase sigma factor CnrH|nr:sigma-70 family RNA polymerase sigma factor [Verrucomicrobiales bacterium]|tara:strand:+ start:658 stop:1242 length:585 start_codon:yes stop_codon:yes gene_type:complete
MPQTSIIDPTAPRELDPKNGDDFTELVNLHHRDLLVYARALSSDSTTAADLVQDAFVVAFDKVNTFDVTRDFATWMRGIIRNKWREWLRKNQKYELTDELLAQIDADIASWQNQRINESNSLFDSLDQGLKRLPDTLRDAVIAYYYEGRNGDEIAERLDIAPAALRKRLQRARSILKQFLDQRLDSPPSSEQDS